MVVVFAPVVSKHVKLLTPSQLADKFNRVTLPLFLTAKLNTTGESAAEKFHEAAYK
jgi:hypothetical protein